MTSFQLAPEPMAKQTPRIRRVPCHGDGLNLGIRPEGVARAHIAAHAQP